MIHDGAINRALLLQDTEHEDARTEDCTRHKKPRRNSHTHTHTPVQANTYDILYSNQEVSQTQSHPLHG